MDPLMYPPPMMPRAPVGRDFVFPAPYPMRWGWIRSMEDARPTRKGKWIPEEEEYTRKLIECFNKGFLNIAQGTTLRSCLSEKLNCDPMRITKKYAGSSCIGKQVYQPCEKTPELRAEMQAAQAELLHLERKFLAKVEHTTRPHRSPYLIYESDSVPIAPGSVPSEYMRHMHPYMMVSSAPPTTRTFFPEYETALPSSHVMQRYPPFPGSFVCSPTSAEAGDTPKSHKSQKDMEEGGLLLDFFKSVGSKKDTKDDGSSEDDESVSSRKDDDETKSSPREKLSEPPTQASSDVAKSHKRRSSQELHESRPYPVMPLPPFDSHGPPPSARHPMLPGVPVPPVPPLDFQGLQSYPYAGVRTFPFEYGAYPHVAQVSDPLHRISYPAFEEMVYPYKAAYPPHLSAMYSHLSGAIPSDPSRSSEVPAHVSSKRQRL